MSIEQGQIISLKDFQALKEKVNTLMKKREFGERPMKAFIATISNETQYSAVDANSIYRPYQRMKSTDANTNPSNQFNSGNKIVAEPFKDEDNYITPYLDFNTYHNNQSNSGCGGYCSGLCTTICGNGCKTACKDSCGSICHGGCRGNCQGGCAGGCSGCSNTCTNSCSNSCTGCGASCLGTSTTNSCGACTATCGASYCESSCSRTCHDVCTACTNNCSSGCGGYCSGGCTGQLEQGNWGCDLPVVYINKIKKFHTSGTWQVPAGVNRIYIFVVGGGGGACNASTQKVDDQWVYSHSAGGGGGFVNTTYSYLEKPLEVTPGQVLTILVGAGGACGLVSVDQIPEYTGRQPYASNGGSSIIKTNDNIILAAKGGYASLYETPGNGGSGGGATCVFVRGNYAHNGGNGGSDGYNGTRAINISGGSGQRNLSNENVIINKESYAGSSYGTTTCPFDSNAYGSGGGGGGVTTYVQAESLSKYTYLGGSGGQNGGGIGNSGSSQDSIVDFSGTNGTGGGGGGAYCGENTMRFGTSGDGGHGVVIIAYYE